MTNKNISTIIISRLGGLLVFIIILTITNTFSNQITNQIFQQALLFINNNIEIIILFSIIFFFGELFAEFIFPLNLPYPIFNAFGSILLIVFLFQIFPQIIIIQNGTWSTLLNLQTPVILIVTFIVLIVGYTKIFSKTKKEKRDEKQKTSWEDVGEELRELIIFFSQKIRKEKRSKKKYSQDTEK